MARPSIHHADCLRTLTWKNECEFHDVLGA